jgi:DNA mismatch endonuclease (patch repair protein)
MTRMRPPLTRSEVMARVHSGGTGVELKVRRELWAQGIRYRVAPSLPGRPDVAIFKAKLAVFVDGCFWHGCPVHYSCPATNVAFWQTKLARNIARDQRVNEELRKIGWRVMRFWGHEVIADLSRVVSSIVECVRKPDKG